MDHGERVLQSLAEGPRRSRTASSAPREIETAEPNKIVIKLPQVLTRCVISGAGRRTWEDFLVVRRTPRAAADPTRQGGRSRASRHECTLRLRALEGLSISCPPVRRQVGQSFNPNGQL